MFNAYAAVLREINAALAGKPLGAAKAIYSRGQSQFNIMLPCLGKADAQSIAALCNERMGYCAIDKAQAQGQSILLRLSPQALGALLRQAMAAAELAEQEPDGDTPTGRAEWKLRTLARKGDKGIAPEQSARRAAWLLLGITAHEGQKARTGARLAQAAQAAEELGLELPPADRPRLRAGCGLIGLAGSALMSAGRKICQENIKGDGEE